jgi:hypothetical protein
MSSERGLAYKDLKKIFSKEDLKEYDKLCLAFAKLTAGKNNMQLWQELVESDAPSEMGKTLNKIHDLRSKYDLSPELGEVFFYVYRRRWRGKYGGSIYEQVSW